MTRRALRSLALRVLAALHGRSRLPPARSAGGGSQYTPAPGAPSDRLAPGTRHPGAVVDAVPVARRSTRWCGARSTTARRSRGRARGCARRRRLRARAAARRSFRRSTRQLGADRQSTSTRNRSASRRRPVPMPFNLYLASAQRLLHLRYLRRHAARARGAARRGRLPAATSSRRRA